MQHLIASAVIISAIALLWRITLKENPVEKFADGLPYLLRKPLTCGVCFTFWVSFVVQFCTAGLPEAFVPFNAGGEILRFFSSWMITGMSSVFVYYVFLAFYEGSHYLAHKAEEMHEHEHESDQ